MINFRQAVKKGLPPLLRAALHRYRVRRIQKEYKSLSVNEVFAKIYMEGAWGQGNGSGGFYSGSGSHDHLAVSTYVECVGEFLAQFPEKPSVVDLGCGDFNVGSQLRSHIGSFIACDIFDRIIYQNRERYGDKDVDFRVLNIAEEELPEAEIAIVRQVLQHLSNRDIARILEKVKGKYKFAIISEHLPSQVCFPVNMDKPSGPDTRADIGSGLVPTEMPFNFSYKTMRVLCEVPEAHGRVQTIVYEL